MYYCNSRYYDPSVGRWLNADGYVSTGQGMLGYNMYAYCNNRSTIMYDPLGNTVRYIAISWELSLIGGGGQGAGIIWDDNWNISLFNMDYDIYNLGGGMGFSFTYGQHKAYNEIGKFVTSNDGNDRNDDDPYFCYTIPTSFGSVGWNTGIASQLEDALELTIGYGPGASLFHETWSNYYLAGNVEVQTIKMMQEIVSNPKSTINTTDVRRYMLNSYY